MRPLEIELKYRVADPEEAARLVRSERLGAFLASGPARTTQLEDRYVDTADGALARAGFAARLRHSPAGDLITLKSLAGGTGGAMHRREELEAPADRAAPPHDWPSSAARSLMLELAGDAPLVELVTVRQLRHLRPYRADDAAVELSVDEVDVVAHGRIVEHFTELEVELREGAEARLQELAEALGRSRSLSPVAGSKLETALAAMGDPGPAHAGRPRRHRSRGDANRPPQVGAAPGTGTAVEAESTGRGIGVGVGPGQGTAVDDDTDEAPAELPADGLGEPTPDVPEGGPSPEGEGPRIVVGRTPGVRADDTLAEAGRKVLRFHFARMLAREPGTRLGKNPEELHGMRVATRRMRAAWRVFGDAYRPRRTRRYRRDLRDIAARLGAVRDLDVLIEHLAAFGDAQGEPERRALEPLLEAWRSERDGARTLLARTLDSDTYRRFVDEYGEFVRTEGLGVSAVTATTPHRVRDRMPSRIWAAYEAVRAYESVLRWADVETLHELRIAAKWLRYTIEFVREPLGPDVAPLIERVVALQDHLGYLHDADVGAALARQFLVERSADLSETETAAIGRFLVERERELARLRRTVGPVWRRVAGLGFRRGLGRVVAGL